MDVVQHQILSLDFRQYTVSYEGKDFPSGTIGCDALNIPARRGYSARCTSKMKKHYQREKRNCHRIYLYQVDFDGEWGEIYFDFVNRTTEIQKLAEWGRMISNPTFQTTSMGDFKQRKLTDKKYSCRDVCAFLTLDIPILPLGKKLHTYLS